MTRLVFLLLVPLAGPLAAAASQDSCKPASLLPAYAHNDYQNPRPLLDALALGFRGVEADVFRVGTELVVGHDRGTLRPARTLARLYLEPLRERLRVCGYVLPDSTRFFLNVELKDADRVGFDYLLTLLRQFEELFRAGQGGVGGAVQVTLVGWWPTPDSVAWPDYLRVQLAIEHQPARPASNGSPVGFVSLDYGKMIKWSGRGTVPPAAEQTLAAARELASPGAVPIRVHHVPVDEVIYEWLLSQGVTLIGTEALPRASSVLQRILANRTPVKKS